MRLTIDLFTTRKDGKLNLDGRVLNFDKDFRALSDNEQLAVVATLKNDLENLLKKGTSIQTRRAGLN